MDVDPSAIRYITACAIQEAETLRSTVGIYKQHFVWWQTLHNELQSASEVLRGCYDLPNHVVELLTFDAYICLAAVLHDHRTLCNTVSCLIAQHRQLPLDLHRSSAENRLDDAVLCGLKVLYTLRNA